MSNRNHRKSLINIEYKVAKPFVDAAALGLGSSAFAVVFQGPAFNWACIGAGFSLCWYWGNANLTRPKKVKARRGGAGPGHIVINGTRKVRLEGGDFEYAPRFVSRETYPQAIWRKLWGKPEPRRVIDQQPHVPREFVFQSYYEGQPVELREDDVRRFLRTAWKYRHRGRGLSQRRWVREWRERPQWYKDLGPYWYYAILAILREAQQLRRCQLVVCTGPQWYALARDPHITLGILREAEKMKGTVQPIDTVIPEADAIDISFDQGESSFAS